MGIKFIDKFLNTPVGEIPVLGWIVRKIDERNEYLERLYERERIKENLYLDYLSRGGK